MPDRRYFRGPRRPSQDGADGAPGNTAGQSFTRAEGESGSGGEGPRTGARRRRRGRGGRGPRPDAPIPAGPEAGSATLGTDAGDRAEGEALSTPYRERGPSFDEAQDRTAGDGGPEGARRKRRRRGRGRRGEGRLESAGQPDLAEGELPSDYIALPVERGMPVPYETRQPEVIQEELELEPARPQRSKRVNSGKLFWYIRSKSYVPIPELRRRFEITPDEMGTIQDDGHKLYIGVPQDVADVVANLRRQQKIGIECSVDFTMPVVIGIYPLNR
jgi:hypothetical protein